MLAVENTLMSLPYNFVPIPTTFLRPRVKLGRSHQDEASRRVIDETGATTVALSRLCSSLEPA